MAFKPNSFSPSFYRLFVYVLIPEWGITWKLGKNSAKFSKILKKGQTKYLRSNHFRKWPNFYNLVKKRHISNPGSDNWFSNEVERTM